MFRSLARRYRLWLVAVQTNPWKTGDDWLGESNTRPRFRLW